MDVDTQLLNCHVPNLILQPIVENAIRHGIAQRSSAGLIEVKAKQVGRMLRLEVKDNGPGIGAGAVSLKRHNTGIGLSNTQSRLSQLYGDDYRFELINDPQGGLRVRLDIPLIRADETRSNAA
jgi:sensor histidine kinase YesM